MAAESKIFPLLALFSTSPLAPLTTPFKATVPEELFVISKATPLALLFVILALTVNPDELWLPKNNFDPVPIFTRIGAAASIVIASPNTEFVTEAVPVPKVMLDPVPPTMLSALSVSDAVAGAALKLVRFKFTLFPKETTAWFVTPPTIALVPVIFLDPLVVVSV